MEGLGPIFTTLAATALLLGLFLIAALLLPTSGRRWLRISESRPQRNLLRRIPPCRPGGVAKQERPCVEPERAPLVALEWKGAQGQASLGRRLNVVSRDLDPVAIRVGDVNR